MYKISKETGQHVQPLSPRANAPMLSEVKIQLPKPQPTKKTSSHQDIPDHFQQSKYPEADSNSLKVDSHCALFSGARTKNSTDSLPFRTESEIISEWIRNLFQKKGLLGPKWQQKFSRKRKDLVWYAFNVVRQYQPRQSSGCLQTQSKHKPYLRTFNQLHALGLQKMTQIMPRLVNKIKQNAFSKILQFLAFQNMKKSTNQDNLMNSVVNSLRISTKNTSQQRLILNYASRQEYDILTSNTMKSVKNVQSTKNLPIIQNQYALAPVSPYVQGENGRYEEEKIRSPRSSRHQMRCSHGMGSSRQSGNNQIQNRVGYDPRYQFIKLKESQYIYSNSNNPPSPKTHGMVHFDQPKLTSQQKIGTQNYQNYHTRPQNPRSSAYIRPHTHNPFATSTHQSSQKQPLNKQKQIQPESRSRAVSASNNIKISFMGSYPYQLHQKKDIPQDYQGGHHQPSSSGNNVYKLGTLENRQMRQSYQMNSINNQLIPQDYPRNVNIFYSPHAPVCSSPVTPKILHSPSSKGMYLSPPLTSSSPYQPYSPAGVHHIGRPGHRGHKNPENKRNQNPNQVENDYNFRKREKLVVTSSRRKH